MVALIGRFAIPLGRRSVILVDSVAVGITPTDAFLADVVPLVGRLLVIIEGLFEILRPSLSVEEHVAQVVQRHGVALFGGFDEPEIGLLVVDLAQPALQIHPAQLVLSLGVALLGQRLEQAFGERVVFAIAGGDAGGDLILGAGAGAAGKARRRASAGRRRCAAIGRRGCGIGGRRAAGSGSNLRRALHPARVGRRAGLVVGDEHGRNHGADGENQKPVGGNQPFEFHFSSPRDAVGASTE